jgi:hypothetical protein
MESDPLQQQTVGEFILENEGNLGIAVEWREHSRQFSGRSCNARWMRSKSNCDLAPGKNGTSGTIRDKVLLKNIAWVGFVGKHGVKCTSCSKFADRRKIRLLALA